MIATRLACAILLAGCLLPAPAPAIASATEVAEMYYERVPSAEIFASPTDALLDQVYGYPADQEGPRATLTLEVGPHPELADRLLGFVSLEPMADDSVRGEKWRVVIVRTDEGWLIEQLGVRFKCWRGTNAGQWTDQLCP